MVALRNVSLARTQVTTPVKKLIEKMLGLANTFRMLTWPGRYYGRGEPIPKEHKPGAMLAHLTPDERELLKTAKPEDFAGLRQEHVNVCVPEMDLHQQVAAIRKQQRR